MPIGTFFRHCPSCGRQFEIRLIAKTEVAEGSELERTKQPLSSLKLAAYPPSRSILAIQLQTGGPATVEVPSINETKEFRYAYRCKHCGHEWFEDEVQTTERKPASDYVGD